MSILLFVLIVLVIILVLFLYSACVISSKCAREEEWGKLKKF